jgi:iron uptake system component EfeO
MSLRDRPFAFVPTLALVVLTAACGGSEGGGTATDVIPVAAADDACEVQAGDLEAGTHEFVVTNGGSTTTEFYVYAEGDRVMAEVENIAPASAGSCSPSSPPGRTRPSASPAWPGRASGSS